jgi:hypothetical protein
MRFASIRVYRIEMSKHLNSSSVATGSTGVNIIANNTVGLTTILRRHAAAHLVRASSIVEKDGWFSVPVDLECNAKPTHHAPISYTISDLVTEKPFDNEKVERLVLLWLADNIQHRYVVLKKSVEFKHEDDAMAFYLRFSGGVSLE